MEHIQVKERKLNKAMLMTILALAGPTMIEQAMQTLVQYIDTAMVGVLGTDATAAVGATTSVNWVILATQVAMANGFVPYISQNLGAGNVDHARRASMQAVLSTLLVGMLFTVIIVACSSRIAVWMNVDKTIHDITTGYFLIMYFPMLPRTASTVFGTVLRASGDSRTPMRIGLQVNVINIVLNMLLIYETRTVSLFGLSMTMPGAGMGVIGAALASAIAFTYGGLAITVKLWKHPVISPKGLSWKPDMEILYPCMKVTLPNMMQRFGTSLGHVVFSSMINSLGAVATAAHTIANTVESAFYIPGYGMQTAAATLSGNAYGAKDGKAMKDAANMMLLLEIILMIMSGAMLFILAPHLMGIFSKSDEVISLGFTVLRMVAVSEPFFGFSLIVQGMLLGVGNTRRAMIYNLTGMWGVRIAGTYICTQIFDLGLVAAWGCMIAHNLLVFTLFGICFIRESWNPLSEKNKI